jgi:hypothetical protein
MGTVAEYGSSGYQKIHQHRRRIGIGLAFDGSYGMTGDENYTTFFDSAVKVWQDMFP